MSWYRLEPADAAFFDAAPQRHVFEIRLPVPPSRVWESLASDESLSAWPMDAGLKVGVRWTTPRPFGVDTTREVVLPLGVMTVRERFFRWDEGSRMSFYVEAANRPGFRRFAEDYVIEADGSGALLTWIVAIEPSPKAARLAPLTSRINKLAFGRTAVAARRYFR